MRENSHHGAHPLRPETAPVLTVLRKRQLERTKHVRTVILVNDRFVLAMLDKRASLAVFPLFFLSLPCPPNALEHLLSEVPRKNDAR